MKYYLIAGEASGDLHASKLMIALKEQDKEAEFRFLGGDLMLHAGGSLVCHYRDMAYMGFIPVLLHSRTILRNLENCKKDIAAYKPDVVILIDYPGFNLKIAKYVKKELDIPVYYYISPKIWAWKKYRLKTIKKYIDRMYCILPFETEFYKKANHPVNYVGNPTVDDVTHFIENFSITAEEFRKEVSLPEKKKIIALLAGSRKQEIKDNLPTMLKVTESFPDYQIIIAGAPSIDPDYYQQFIKESNTKIVYQKTYSLLQHSRAALVTSGTATLEAALFLVPQVVCYYTPAGPFISFVFRHFFPIRFISLVNLIAQREVVKEYFGENFSVKNIRKELESILADSDHRRQMIFDYEDIIRILGAPGASEKAASLIFSSLTKK